MAKAPPKASSKRSDEPRVVQGVGAAVGSRVSGDVSAAARIEKAMADAVMKALADGVTDPDEQRKIIVQAREKAVAEMGKA